MIRKGLILLWMLFPVTVAAYHVNYGSKQVARERAYRQLCEIRELERLGIGRPSTYSSTR